MSTKALLLLVVAVVLAIGVGATKITAVLGAGTDNATINAPVPAVAASVKPAAVDRDFVGKPLAPINVGYQLNGQPSVGQPIEIVVSVTPQLSMTNASLTLTAPEGLVLTTPSVVPIADTPAGGSVNTIVRVLAPVADVYHLSVFVEGSLGGALQARSIQIPIRLADAPSSTPAQLEKTDGQSLRVMPAAEAAR